MLWPHEQSFDYDHVNPDDKYINNEGRRCSVCDLVNAMKSNDIILAEIKKCRLICKNCHK